MLASAWSTHSDFKPANIMVAGNRFKLSDFGVAKLDLAGSGAGTHVYMAPEALLSNTTNVTTEVFSAGITLFQLCNNYPDLFSQVASIDIVKAGRVIQTVGYRNYVPSRVRTICNKACAVDPARRYQSVEEMRQAMERLRVTRDWQCASDLHWTAKAGTQVHEMMVSGAAPVDCVYLVNGRRKNANCTQVTNLDQARLYQHKWVADNSLG
jgi:serine/threonine protein kinase